MILSDTNKKLLELLPRDYVKTLRERLENKYSKSYIGKVVNGRRANITILTAAIKLAEEQKASQALIKKRAESL